MRSLTLFGAAAMAAALALSAGAAAAVDEVLTHEDGTVVLKLVNTANLNDEPWSDGVGKPVMDVGDEFVILMAEKLGPGEGFGGFILFDFIDNLDDVTLLPGLGDSSFVERRADIHYPAIGESTWHIVHGYLMLPDGTMWRTPSSGDGGEAERLQIGVEVVS